MFVMGTLYTVCVGEASRISNVDLSVRGPEISFVTWKVCVCVRRCVCAFRGVVDRTQAELKTARGRLSCSVD